MVFIKLRYLRSKCMDDFKLRHMIIKEIARLVNEGVYDPGILKAIWLGGGPGSGKSFISNYVFGMIDDKGNTISKSVNPYGLKVSSSDNAFEFLLKKANINMKDLRTMANSEFEKYTKGDQSERGRAKKITEKILEYYMNGRLGVIFDGTSSNTDKINKQEKLASSIGYDTYMLFISTNIDVAMERNRQRDRSLPDKIVIEKWNEATRNKSYYKSLFGSHFFEIENNEKGLPSANVSKQILKCIQMPIENPIGKEWVKNELELRNKLKKI